MTKIQPTSILRYRVSQAILGDAKINGSKLDFKTVGLRCCWDRAKYLSQDYFEANCARLLANEGVKVVNKYELIVNVHREFRKKFELPSRLKMQ